MAKPKTTQRTTESKVDARHQITNKIITALENGVRPWVQSWSSTTPALPKRHNGEYYSGINTLVLWVTAQEKGYSSRYWMTFNQAKEYGAHIKSGEKCAYVVNVGNFVPKESDDEKAIPFLKAYAVFNADQIENLPAKFYEETQTVTNENEHNEYAETFFANIGSTIVHGSGRPSYSPSTDSIHMPTLDKFKNANSYYATMAHEHAHWTGAKSRLDRQFGKRFGDDAYAMEELVAELSAAYTCAHIGIASRIEQDHAAYIDAWVKVLKSDKRAIFTAASAAQAATDHLISLQRTEVDKAA